MRFKCGTDAPDKAAVGNEDEVSCDDANASEDGVQCVLTAGADNQKCGVLIRSSGTPPVEKYMTVDL